MQLGSNLGVLGLAHAEATTTLGRALLRETSAEVGVVGNGLEVGSLATGNALGGALLVIDHDFGIELAVHSVLEELESFGTHLRNPALGDTELVGQFLHGTLLEEVTLDH